jgi:hypothetical protein
MSGLMDSPIHISTHSTMPHADDVGQFSHLWSAAIHCRFPTFAMPSGKMERKVGKRQ